MLAQTKLSIQPRQNTNGEVQKKNVYLYPFVLNILLLLLLITLL